MHFIDANRKTRYVFFILVMFMGVMSQLGVMSHGRHQSKKESENNESSVVFH